jgi:hypothetical protein
MDFFQRCDLKLSRKDLCPPGDRRRPSFQKRIFPKFDFLGKAISPDFQCSARANRLGFNGLEARTGKIGSQELMDALNIPRRTAEAGTPSCENRFDLCCVFFRYKLIEPRLCFEQQSFNRQLGSIVRMKMKGASRAIEDLLGKGARKSECKPVGGEEGGGTLAATDQETAAALLR